MKIKTIALFHPGNMGVTIGATAAIAAPKAWRYVGEMREIAATFEAAGLPAGFHNAAADICERLAPFKDRAEPPLAVSTVVDTLCAPPEKLRRSSR